MQQGNEGTTPPPPAGPPSYSGSAWPPPPPPPPGDPYGNWRPPAAPAPAGSNRAAYGLIAVVASVVAALAVGTVGMGTYMLARGGLASIAQGPAPIQTYPQNGGSTTQNGSSVNGRAIASKVEPFVVDVNTTVATGDPGGRTAQAAGTGIVVGSSGDVLTNNHVVKGATSIQVTLPGRSNSYPATVLGTDPGADVALIKIQGVSGLPTATFANSSNLQAGEPVVAIGNAGGQGGAPSVTSGSITALNQSITAADDQGGSEQLTNMIQTDASIQPGDSGGPLVNKSAQVVGMITAGDTGGGQSPGAASTTGFAIPSNTAVDIVNKIRSGQGGSGIILGASQSALLGVDVAPINSRAANQCSLTVTSGALVTATVQGSPAAQAGIPSCSVITAIDNTEITSTNDLSAAMQTHRPGDQIKVTYVDDNGASHVATITAAAGPTL